MAPHCTTPSPIWVPDIPLHCIINLLKCFSVLLNNLWTSPLVQILWRLNVSFSMNITGWAQTKLTSLQEPHCVSSYSIYHIVSYFSLIDIQTSLPLIHYNFLTYRRHTWTMKQKWLSVKSFFPLTYLHWFSRTKVNYKLLTGWFWLTRNITWNRSLRPTQKFSWD